MTPSATQARRGEDCGTGSISCRNCFSTDPEIFYESKSVPVNSCILLDSPDAARAYPTGQIELAHCRRCGFVWNVRFDQVLAKYNNAYEEQQSYSPRFNTFANELARSWIDRHSIRDKTVLEVGCGKGDFLMLLCRLGRNRGIGIDPSYVEGRLEKERPAPVTFIPDFYSQRYSHLQADVVCCRHTLEHIPDTAAFMKMIRESIGDRPETLVLVELPDVVRVLKECAFWDIYYEHCSYFSLGSLARLFRLSGFDVLALSKEYDDQYLLIEARPSTGPASASLPEEDDLHDLSTAVAEFRRTHEATVRNWKLRIEAWLSEGKKLAIWGSGSKCVAFLNTLGMNHEIDSVVDINPHRHGKFLPGTGKEICAPSALTSRRPDVVIAMNPIYLDEIRRDLAAMSLHPELTAV